MSIKPRTISWLASCYSDHIPAALTINLFLTFSENRHKVSYLTFAVSTAVPANEVEAIKAAA